MRRDLAQCRIGTNQNQFYGTSTQVSFVSSTSRLKTNYVSDQRLVTYYIQSNTIYRAVVEPTISNYTNKYWDPINTNGWTNANWNDYVKSPTNAEALLEGVYGYPGWNNGNPFKYILRTGAGTDMTATANPPSGLIIGFAAASRSSTRSGRPDNASERKTMKYDIELNIPPPFNP
jgi:hypothetical protein